MGNLYHSSFTTASLFHTDDLNPPLSSIESALIMTKNMVKDGGGDVSWDSTVGSLAWSLPLQLICIDPDSGKMAINTIASGSLTIPAENIAVADLSTVNGATISATYIAISTASTGIIPKNRFILGAVNTALQFYPRQFSAPLDNILNTLSTNVYSHQIDSSAVHSGTIVEGNIVVGSSAGLPIDSNISLTDVTSTIAALVSSVAANSTAIGILNSSVAANSTAIGVLNSSVAANSTAIGVLNSSVAANSSALTHLMSEASISGAATFTIDFTSAAQLFIVLTTDASAMITGGQNGRTYRLRVQQDATGNWTLSLGVTANSIKWIGGAAPTISTGATVSDIIELTLSNSTWFGSYRQAFA